MYIDSAADSVRLPFASFVDQKMVKDVRRQEIINRSIQKEIDRVQRQYEL